MPTKLWIAIMSVCTIYAATLNPAYAGQSFDKKPISWQKALQKANSRVDNYGGASVLGTFVGEYVRRCGVHQEERQKMQAFYDEVKNNPNVDVRTCVNNYNQIKQAAQAQKLFSNYELTALVPFDFCALTPENLKYIVRFFAGQVSPRYARQYKKAILLRLDHYFNPSQSVTFWFVVNPKDKTLTFNLNDPLSLEAVEELRTPYKNLAVY